jgi:hypothetical protein
MQIPKNLPKNSTPDAGVKQMQGEQSGVPGTEVPGTDIPASSGANDWPPDNADTSTVAVEKRDREAFDKAFGTRGRESTKIARQKVGDQPRALPAGSVLR